MTRIIVDAGLRSKLHDLSQPFELYDESGRILGRFLPTPDPSLYDSLNPQISEEEIEKRKLSKGQRSYTTAEVLAHLEKL